jgi:TetR/AcrR family transcriptional regulator, transcriptional repressor for nem operon
MEQGLCPHEVAESFSSAHLGAMDTAERILDVAEELIREKGYNGFSFQDIAERIGIKKGSLYYHFPAKADLGNAVLDRYRRHMSEAAIAIDARPVTDYWADLVAFLQPIIALGKDVNGACLAGVLGGEFLSLPEPMQAEVGRFFDEEESWLARFLGEGRGHGAFAFPGEPVQMARLVISAIEGGLLIKRAQRDPARFDELIETISRVLGRAEPASR